MDHLLAKAFHRREREKERESEKCGEANNDGVYDRYDSSNNLKIPSADLHTLGKDVGMHARILRTVDEYKNDVKNLKVDNKGVNVDDVLWSLHLQRDLTHNWFAGLYMSLPLNWGSNDLACQWFEEQKEKSEVDAACTTGTFMRSAYEHSRAQRRASRDTFKIAHAHAHVHADAHPKSRLKVVIHFRAGDVRKRHPRYQHLEYVLKNLDSISNALQDTNASSFGFDVTIVSQGHADDHIFRQMVEHGKRLGWRTEAEKGEEGGGEDIDFLEKNVKTTTTATTPNDARLPPGPTLRLQLGDESTVMDDFDTLTTADVLFTSRSSFAHWGAWFARDAVVVADRMWLCENKARWREGSQQTSPPYEDECVHRLVYEGFAVVFTQGEGGVDVDELKRLIQKKTRRIKHT